jgi:type I restriction enzyme R subunit
LLEGLEETGYGMGQLVEVGKLIEAEKSDLYDVLTYIAFNMAPVTRAERVDSHRDAIFRATTSGSRNFCASCSITTWRT